MATERDKRDRLYKTLRDLQVTANVSGFTISDGPEPSAWVEVVGKPTEKLVAFLAENPDFGSEEVKQDYYFLGGELRPGSGVIRNCAGGPRGPGGTLSSLLTSMDGRRVYFAAAAHVVSNFWEAQELADPALGPGARRDVYWQGKVESESSIYRYRKGFPGTNSSRFLGKLFARTPRPRYVEDMTGSDREVTLDVGLVELKGRFDLRQRTTGYGTFGEWPGDPLPPERCREVMKCGAEETHWTAAIVIRPNATVRVYAPGGERFVLHRQVILADLKSRPRECLSELEEVGPARLPNNPEDVPFAVPGDSGSIVVDRESKRPLGMLIAGSVLDGRYVMTPMAPIMKYWSTFGLVMMRA